LRKKKVEKVKVAKKTSDAKKLVKIAKTRRKAKLSPSSKGAKKPKPKKKTEKEKTFSELIKMISHTQQHLDFVNDEVVKNSFEIQKLISHMAFMEHNLLETRKMLEFVVSNLNPNQSDIVHKRFELKKSPPPVNVDKIKSKEEKEKEKNKKFAMHDNITTRCKNCKAIGLITEDNCKECGAKI
jgi:hypothetical protein